MYAERELLTTAQLGLLVYNDILFSIVPNVGLIISC